MRKAREARFEMDEGTHSRVRPPSEEKKTKKAATLLGPLGLNKAQGALPLGRLALSPPFQPLLSSFFTSYSLGRPAPPPVPVGALSCLSLASHRARLVTVPLRGPPPSARVGREWPDSFPGRFWRSCETHFRQPPSEKKPLATLWPPTLLGPPLASHPARLPGLE